MFRVGQLVLNLGTFVGRVVEILETGDLVLSGHGLMIAGEKWVADPKLCEPFVEEGKSPVVRHRNALHGFWA